MQRKLKIGYSRAARILDQLEEAGVIGAAEGSKPREVLITESELDAETHIAMTEAMHGKKSITYDYQETEDNQTNESDENEEENDDEIIKEDEQSITHKVVTFDDNEYDEEEYENDNIEKNN